jgi:hypothetical protein
MRRMTLVAVLSAFAACGLAQYTASVLPVPQGYPWAVGNGAAEGVFAGYGVPPGGSAGTDDRAILWIKGSPFDVTPPNRQRAVIVNSRDGQHVGNVAPEGFGYGPLAFLWDNYGNGTLLHPSGYSTSEAIGVGGGKQVGQVVFSSYCSECGYFVQRHAVQWSGTAESAQLIHTPGFGETRLEDTDGTRHVGSSYVAQQGQYRALLWNAGLLVDLHPPAFASSFAYAIYGDTQVGWGETQSGDGHALLWRGSAASVVDLNPAGYSLSVAYGAGPDVQVGGGRTIVYGPDRALAWRGSAAAVIDLHALLPEGFRLRNSIAEDVDRYGNIIGTCSEDASGLPRAVVWSPVGKRSR